MKLKEDAELALLDLLTQLEAADYRFVTVTPATHARVVGRPNKNEAQDLRDVFGWSLPFAPELLPGPMHAALEAAGVLVPAAGGRLRSLIRVSRLDPQLFIHSAYPTEEEDAVFFGPDSYRFVDFLHAELAASDPVRRLVDVGAGGGVGGISAARFVPGARITLADVNPIALRVARVNARHSGVPVEIVESSGIAEIDGGMDCVVANPPFIMDGKDRAYRDGGGLCGAQLSLDWTLEAAERITPGGRILLYTGVAIVNGENQLCHQLAERLPALGCTMRCREIDPDIFGEELDEPPYAKVERIAAVGIVVTKDG